jgi:hypothetical protein
VCDPGHYDHDTNAASPCETCPAGTYQDQSSAFQCTACPMGRTSFPGSSSLDACCLAGNTGTRSSCSACDPGYYDHDANAVSPCESCPANTYQDQHGATGCTTCPMGRTSKPGTSSATACCLPGTEEMNLRVEFFFGTSLPNVAINNAILDDGTGFHSKRDQGLSYGWDCDGDTDIDFSSGRRPLDRGDGLGLNHFGEGHNCNGKVSWHVEVPSGIYDAVVDFGEGGVTPFPTIFGDPTSMDESKSSQGCEYEGVVPCADGGDCIYKGFVEVSDGRFTVTGGFEARVCHSISRVSLIWIGNGNVNNQSLCLTCDPGRFDHDANAASPCENCPVDTYQDQPGALHCTACPMTRPLAGMGSFSVEECTATWSYVGCFEDRESLADTRDLQGARLSMGAGAALEVCAKFCAGYAYMGLQRADQCFCGNVYGTYGAYVAHTTYGTYGYYPLVDESCGTRGDACGQNITKPGACAMRSAIFRLPAPWTCADHECDPTMANRPTTANISALHLTVTEAHAACCDVSCVVWSATEACVEGTVLITRFAETTVVGADPQASCCTGPCLPGTWNDGGWCEPCAAGTVSTTDGAADCNPCTAGTYSAEGSVECLTCAIGRIDHDGSAATPCIPCAAGRFSDTGSDTVSCTGRCAPGSYAAEGAPACVPCDAGQYDHDADASTPCRLCVAGKFSGEAMATACTACAPGLASVGGSSSCKAPRLPYLQERCPAQWAVCEGLSGCPEALAAALAAPVVPEVSSSELLTLLACVVPGMPFCHPAPHYFCRCLN